MTFIFFCVIINIMRVLKFILNILLWVFIVGLFAILIVNIYFMYNVRVLNNQKATVFGFSYQVGMNYSMEPTLSQNDFIITYKQDNYKVNDIVTFIAKENNNVTTHRIIKITDNGYITRGDSKYVTSDDEEITNNDIIGKVVVVVPLLGAVLRIMLNPVGAIIIIAIIVVAVLFVTQLMKNFKKDNEEVDIDNKERNKE